uniref:V-type proton ATPase subunit S1/VOA1 transmembrane domain-containing protein n=1 Tax=Panagrolaimus superbus TaxID=310955 RepID=A0A914YYG3_9BILA
MYIFYSLLIFALLGTFSVAVEHSNDLEVERVKRVVVEDVDVDFASNDEPSPARLRQKSPSRASANPSTKDAQPVPNPDGVVPIVLPPYHDANIAPFDTKKRSCLLYLEGITILVLDFKSIGGAQKAYTLPLIAANDSYGYQDSYVVCPPGPKDGGNFTTGTPFSFVIDYRINKPRQLVLENSVVMTVSKGFMLTLNFVSNSGFDLASAVLEGLTIEKGQSGFITKDLIRSTNASNALGTNIRAYFGYNYACSVTPALLFPVKEDPDFLVGIILNNFQVQGYGVDKDGDKTIPYFSTRTADCIPTFNQGTWMGIIVTLILVSVLAFAFLMLNSVQTMDRFDDPKQKQIVINFKE